MWLTWQCCKFTKSEIQWNWNFAKSPCCEISVLQYLKIISLFTLLFAGGNKAALIAVAVCLTIVVMAAVVVFALVCYHRQTGQCPCTSTKDRSKFREPVSTVTGSTANAGSTSGANSRDTGDLRSGDDMDSQREAFSLDDSQHVAPPTYSQALTHNVVRL